MTEKRPNSKKITRKKKKIKTQEIDEDRWGVWRRNSTSTTTTNANAVPTRRKKNFENYKEPYDTIKTIRKQNKMKAHKIDEIEESFNVEQSTAQEFEESRMIYHYTTANL